MKAVLLLLIASLPLMGLTQENDLLLDGTLMADTGTALLEGTVVVIDETGRECQRVPITENMQGKFELRLPFDHVFDLRFEREEYTAKIIVVDTKNIPPEEQEWGYEFGGFRVVLNEPSIERNQVKVARIFYASDVQNFSHEPLH